MRFRVRRRHRALFAALCGLVLGGCGGHTPPERHSVPVQVQRVERSRSAGELRYSAAIRPNAQVDLMFKVSGYIDEILQVRGADGQQRNVQDGDFVRRGTVLAKVRPNEYRDRLAEARASLTQARADFERATRMYENSTIAKAEYDGAFARAQSSQARYDQAAEALNDCALAAPMDGTVLRRSLEIGSLVSPGTAAFVVADTRAVKAVVGVPDVALTAIRLGDTLRVDTEAVPDRALRGLVTRVAPSADPNSRIFEVECTIPNPDGRLKIGMIAAIHVVEQVEGAGATLVPLKAIVRAKNDPNGYAVFVVEAAGEKHIARMQPVELGEVVGNSIVVTGGLQGGEDIVVTGATLVADQQEVHVVP